MSIKKLIRVSIIFILGAFSAISMSSAQATIMSDLEGPTNDQPVSGIGIIRGWAFSDGAGVRISQATLRIDGKDINAIPCCSVRADVQSSFPQFPVENTRNSGFGVTFNYGNLTAGPHTITVVIQDSNGTSFERTHTVTVVKAGDSSYLDQANLNSASAELQGQDVVIAGLQVRDKASQQEKRVNARLRWFQNIQALGLVETSAAMATEQTTPSEAKQVTPLAEKVLATSAADIQYAALESPNHGDTGSGIAIVRGWAVAPTGRTIQRVQLFVDGQPSMTIPCCSHRSDVAAALPNEPNAANSGFGVTLNYGNLSAGVHSITVEVEDSSGSLRKFVRGILVRNPGDFSFLEQVDLGTTAQVRVAGGYLVIEGALVRDKATGQTAKRNLRYRWNTPSQAFVLAEDSVNDAMVTDLTCNVDGDTSSLENLKRNPGPSGISINELNIAIHKSSLLGRVFVQFERPGTISCPNIILSITAPITLNGDVNGDRIPDIKFVQGNSNRFQLMSNDVTIQGFAFEGTKGSFDPIEIVGPKIENIAISNNKINKGANVIHTDTYNIETIKNFLISNNSIGDSETGISMRLSKTNGEFRNVIIADNLIENSSFKDILVELDEASSAVISGFNIADNIIKGNGIELNTFGSTEGSVIEVNIIGNQMTEMERTPIRLASFETILGEVRDNTISSFGSVDHDIQVVGNVLTKTLIEGNQFSNIEVLGTSKSTIIADINNNKVSTGISLESDVKSQTVVNIINNDILGGISVYGGNSEGLINSKIIKNRLLMQQEDQNSIVLASGIEIYGGINNKNNVMDTLITDNRVNGFRNGIEIVGGYSDKEVSSENFISAELISNLADEINSKFGGKGINILGGVRGPGSSTIVDNEVQADVTNNVSNGILCKDNISGNTAKCAFSGNTDTSGGGQSAPLAHSTGMSYSTQRQFATHMQQLGVKAQRLRERANTISDPQLRKRLLDLSEDLYKTQFKMSARISGVPLSALGD